MKLLTYLALTLLLTFLAACTGQEPAAPVEGAAAPPVEATDLPPLETAVPVPTDIVGPPKQIPTQAPTSAAVEEPAQEPPTAEPVIEPGPTVAIEATAEVEGSAPLQVISGQTAEGAYFYGSPDAPVTLFDYSDFL